MAYTVIAQVEEVDIRDHAMQIRAMGERRRLEAITKLTDEQRKKYAEVLKREAKSAYTPSEFDMTLVNLGDQETIQKQVDLLVHGDGREWHDALQLVRTVRDPKVIAAIAPALFGEIRDLPNPARNRSELVQEVVFEMLAETPGFSGEMQEWAKTMRTRSVPHYLILLLRGWWKENEEHFKAGNYLAVHPVEPSQEAREWADKFYADYIRNYTPQAPPRTVPLATPFTVVAPSPPAIAPPVSPADASGALDAPTRFRWPLIAGALLLLGGLSWLVIRRKI